MTLKLALNTGFLTNRYSNSEDWGKLCKNILQITDIQLTADYLNPSFPKRIFHKQTQEIKRTLQKFDLNLHSTFTGSFTRLNHLSHPNEEIQKYWINWFKKFIDFTIELGGKSMGSHLGILTYKENNNLSLKKKRINKLIQNWHLLGNYAKSRGLDFLAWEPMSISRELGETIHNCELIQEKLNLNSPIKFKICYDVDHGNALSGNKDDTNPFKWIKRFKNDIGFIHLKQSIDKKHGHWPFVNEYNKIGKVKPKEILKILKENNICNIALILELNFKEREPFDSLAINQVNESIKYWKKFLK